MRNISSSRSWPGSMLTSTLTRVPMCPTLLPRQTRLVCPRACAWICVAAACFAAISTFFARERLSIMPRIGVRVRLLITSVSADETTSSMS
jgi:hypothetical protein